MSPDMNDDELHQPLTRTDFDTAEQWYRYCHEGGLDPFERDDEFNGVKNAIGPYGQLAGAIYGQTRRAYQRTWEAWGLSKDIAFEDVQRVYRAIAFANCLGRVLSTRLDVTWSTVGITSDVIVAAMQRRLLDWLRRWLDRHAGWAAYVWVLERGTRRGVHSHVMLQVPDELGAKLRRDSETALTRIVGRPLVNEENCRTILVQPRGSDVWSQWRRFRYMMKGLEPNAGWPDNDEPSGVHAYAERLHIEPRAQGEIDGKRVGVSRALDEASFRRWAALNDFPPMEIAPWGGPLYDWEFWNWFVENQETIREPGETRNGNVRTTNGSGRDEETEMWS